MSPHVYICEGVLLAALITCILRTQYAYGCAIKPCRTHFEEKILINDCETKENIEELCQRCAKQTKSNIVYPMCCEGTEEAREWCQRYINYGLQERHLLTTYY